MRQIFTGVLVVSTILSTMIWTNYINFGNELIKGILGTIFTLVAIVDFILLMLMEE